MQNNSVIHTKSPIIHGMKSGSLQKSTSDTEEGALTLCALPT